MIDTVVFDLDGTLVDTMTSAPQAYAQTVLALGGPELSTDDVIAAWHVGSTSVVLEHFLSRPVTADDQACFAEHFAAAVAEVRPFPGVVELLDAVRSRGINLGIFTTATRWAAELMLGNAGIDDRFEVLVGGDEVAAPKPAAEGLELACRLLRTEASGAVYVGDAGVDLECAKAAGAHFIHAMWGSGAGLPGDHLSAHHPDDVLRFVAGR